ERPVLCLIGILLAVLRGCVLQNRARPLCLTPCDRLVSQHTSFTCSIRPCKIRLRRCQQARTRLCQEHVCSVAWRNSMYFLGIDLAKKTFDVTLLTPEAVQRHHTFPNTPAGFRDLWRWVRTQDAIALRACMEATNVYWEALAHYLVEQGATVHV